MKNEYMRSNKANTIEDKSRVRELIHCSEYPFIKLEDSIHSNISVSEA